MTFMLGQIQTGNSQTDITIQEFVSSCQSNVNIEKAYTNTHSSIWNAIHSDPFNRKFYQAGFWLEEAYRRRYAKSAGTKQAEKEFKQHAYKLYEHASKTVPSWAEALYYLSNDDYDNGNCELARSRCLQALDKGDDIDYIEKCFWFYVSLSVLGGITGNQERYDCTSPESLPLHKVMQQLDEEYNLLLPLEKRLVNVSVWVSDFFLRMKRAFVRATYAYKILSIDLPSQALQVINYGHLKVIVQPENSEISHYDPMNFAKLLGLDKQFNQLATIQKLKWDLAFQKIFLLVDADQGQLETESKTLSHFQSTDGKETVIVRLYKGDYENAALLGLAHLRQSQEELYSAIDNYNKLMNIFAQDEDPWEILISISQDLHGSTDLKFAWLDLAQTASRQLLVILGILPVIRESLLLVDVVRRLVDVQPWAGRYFAKSDKLRPWLRDAHLLPLIERDNRFAEIDRWIFSGYPYPWQNISNSMEVLRKRLEDHLFTDTGGAENTSLKSILGIHVWSWLNKNSQQFLLNAERLYWLEVVMANGSPNLSQDFSGIYSLYHKAFEVMLKKSFEHYLRTTPEKTTFINSSNIVKQFIGKLQDKRLGLPKTVYEWAEQLNKRFESIHNLRNASTHSDRLPFDDFLRIRHHLLGCQYKNQRTVSIFWLIYAIDQAIQPQQSGTI